MRLTGGLRWRLLAAIGMLAAMLLALLVVLLLSIRDQHRWTVKARTSAQVVLAASQLQAALSELAVNQRAVALTAPGGPYVAAWTRDVATVRTREQELRKLGDDTASQAQIAAVTAATERYLATDATAFLRLAQRDPAAARHQLANPADDARVEPMLGQLRALISRETGMLAQRRAAYTAKTHLVQIVGISAIAATLLIVVAYVLFVERAVLAPLRRVVCATRAITAGDLHIRVRGRRGHGELSELAWAFDQMAVSLRDNRDALERQNAELARQSDELGDAVRSAREGASVLRAVLDATPDAIALVHRDGGVLVDNPPMRAVRAAVGTHATAIDDRGALVPLDASEADRETRDELTLLGTHRAFARYAAPVHDSGNRLIGRLLVLREITGEREAERVKDEFFALVSHELRTPLTAILGFVELVLAEEEAPLADEPRRYLEVVERNAQRLLRLVGDLLFAAQVEAGTLLLEPGVVDLAALVRDAVDTARPQAEDAGVALDAAVADVGETTGDRDRLAQVLDNLVGNAVKFTPDGGRVAVRLTQADGEARIEVADSGVGIPAPELPRLFHRFYRASNATARAIPGLGLGLMIVRAIVEGHGGAVTVRSEVGAGTTFTVTLPLMPPAVRERGGAAVRYLAGGR